ncbi:MAG: hypothetical protein ACTHMT_07115 [Verrucomicrobiota bacterium]
MSRVFNKAPYPAPLPLEQVKVFPLPTRKSLSEVDKILVDPDSDPAPISESQKNLVRSSATAILKAREKDATVMLIYGAHLLRNGAASILERMMAEGFITHLATNGAGTIHDWEYAYLGRSTESVEQNVATGTFGTWNETGRNIHLALYAGSLRGDGYGQSLGRFITEDGAQFPTRAELESAIRTEPAHPLTAARADLLQAMQRGLAPEGAYPLSHNWKRASILAAAFRHGVPLTVHPGIGYDIISNHPIFNGALIGRAATHDFKLFGGSLQKLDNGVVLSVGSAIMGPQVFEKSLSCVNNLRLQNGRKVVHGHSIYVVDLQDGGNWDWKQGEPPKSNPAYYLRFCKSFSRMGGTMEYLQCDNLSFIHNLYRQLRTL